MESRKRPHQQLSQPRLAADVFPTVLAAQAALCPPLRAVEPDSASHAEYEELYVLYRALYFAMGDPRSSAIPLGHVLPNLRALASRVNTGGR